MAEIYINTCAECRKTFITKAPQQGKRCRSCAATFRWNGTRKPARSCPTCNKPLTQIQISADRTYCSMKCRDSFRRVERTCKRCEKAFTVSRSTASRYNYCSFACKTADTAYVECRRCGKEFNNPTNHARHYCSEVCRRPPIFKTCETCEQPFRVMPKVAEKRAARFCSFRCYRKFQGETWLERIVRVALESFDIPFMREHRIGKDVFDFYIPAAQLLIEADGTYWHGTEKVKARDARKNERATRQGYAIARLPEESIRQDANAAWLFRLASEYKITSANGRRIKPRTLALPLY